MNKNTTLNLRIDNELKQEFATITSSYGYDSSKVITAFIEEVVQTGLINDEITKHLTPRKSDDIYSIHYIKTIITSYLKSKNDNYITKVYLFGSYARSEQTKYSDINLRIEIDKDLNLFDLGSFIKDIQALTGKKVDVVVGNPESKIFSDDIKKDELCIYERSRQ